MFRGGRSSPRSSHYCLLPFLFVSSSPFPVLFLVSYFVLIHSRSYVAKGLSTRSLPLGIVHSTSRLACGNRTTSSWSATGAQWQDHTRRQYGCCLPARPEVAVVLEQMANPVLAISFSISFRHHLTARYATRHQERGLVKTMLTDNSSIPKPLFPPSSSPSP